MNQSELDDSPKPVKWVGSSHKDLKAFPKAVRITFGLALFEAQLGRRPPCAKPLKGFGGASVLELVEDDRSGTFRAIYTIQFAEFVYVLHVFQKKSTQGIKTAGQDLDNIRARLKMAEKHYENWKVENGR